MPNLSPIIPPLGATVDYFGLEAMVLNVEPHGDYWWDVELEVANGGGSTERWTVTVPTDYQIGTGIFAYDDQDDDRYEDDDEGIDRAAELDYANHSSSVTGIYEGA